MLNYIWGGLIIASAIYSIFAGTLNDVTTALMQGTSDAVEMTISLMGIMCFWTGIMKIAENTGVTSAISVLLKPLMKILFPKLKDKKALDAIAMNMTANMLGMSNAATPLGLKAMDYLSKYSKDGIATNDMCMFIVINTASIQLIPSTVIAMRQAAESVNSTEIILPVWICSICAVAIGVIAAKINSRREKC